MVGGASLTGLGDLTTEAGLGAGGREAGDIVAGGRFKSALCSAGRQVKPLTEIILFHKKFHKENGAGDRRVRVSAGSAVVVRSFCQERWSRKVGPRCRTSNSTKVYSKNQNRSKAGKKLETRKCTRKLTKLNYAKTREETWEKLATRENRVARMTARITVRI